MKCTEWQSLSSVIGKKTGCSGCPGLALAKPVLDAFADDEEVALDEPLDDLAVPLLPRAQPAGRGHRLVTTGDKKSNVDNFPTNKYFVSVFFFF